MDVYNLGRLHYLGMASSNHSISSIAVFTTHETNRGRRDWSSRSPPGCSESERNSHKAKAKTSHKANVAQAETTKTVPHIRMNDEVIKGECRSLSMIPQLSTITYYHLRSFKMANVLVFGASGAVGSAAAIEARKRGAKVWLALRDINKTVQSLEVEEKKGGYERVQADRKCSRVSRDLCIHLVPELTYGPLVSDPATVAAAVKNSGATAAFVYTLWGSPDSMKSTFEALKEAGITYLVLLSSYSVKVPASATDTTLLVQKVHVNTEIALEQTKGLRTAVLHPAYFSSNLFLFAQGVQQGAVELYHPNAVLDFIVPTDIGAVAG